MAGKSTPELLLLVCVIYGREFLAQVLETFVEIGISGATVIHSQGMARILMRDVPLFAGFKELLGVGGPFNYTVLSVVKDPEVVDKLIDLVPGLRQGVSSKGILFTVPVSRFVNFNDLPSDT